MPGSKEEKNTKPVTDNVSKPPDSSIKGLRGLFQYPQNPSRWSGHKAKVHTVAWSPHGDRLASGSVDKTVRVYNTETTMKTQTMPSSVQLTAHTSSVDQLTWNPAAHCTLATASCDKSIRIWDLRENKNVCKIDTTGENINIAWSPCGNYIAVGNKKDVVTLFDTRTTKPLRVKQFNHEVNEFAWEPTGTYLCLTTDMGTVEMYTNDLLRKHKVWAHPSNIYAIEFDKSRRYFACGSADALVSLFQLPEMICLRSFGALEKPVRTLSFAHDSSMIAAASEECLIYIAHVETGEELAKINTAAPINNVSWHPKDYIIAYAGDDKDRFGQDEGSIFVVKLGSNTSPTLMQAGKDAPPRLGLSTTASMSRHGYGSGGYRVPPPPFPGSGHHSSSPHPHHHHPVGHMSHPHHAYSSPGGHRYHPYN